MFSRNISRRTEENYKYYAVKDRIRNKFSGLKGPVGQPQALPLLPLPPVPPEAARSPGPGPHPDLLPPLRHPVHQEELTYVWICHPESGRAGRRGQGPLPHGLLRPLPPHRCAPRLRGRLTLSYDLTFLDLLLSSLYEGESECVTGSGHCPIHPIRKINWRHSGPTDYCADMSVALHYYNAADKWNDDHSLLGLGFEKLLDSPAQTAAQRWPRQCNAIRTCLDRLAQLEAEGSEDLDAVAGCFGELMAELFDYKQDTGRRSCGASASIWQIHLPAGRLR